MGALASLAGVGVYNFLLKKTPLRKILLWTSLAGVALGLTQLMLVTGGLLGGWWSGVYTYICFCVVGSWAGHGALGCLRRAVASAKRVLWFGGRRCCRRCSTRRRRRCPNGWTRPAGFNRTLGLSDELFALADTALLTVLGQVAFMPLLVLAARICPEVGAAAGAAGAAAACVMLPATAARGTPRPRNLSPALRCPLPSPPGSPDHS